MRIGLMMGALGGDDLNTKLLSAASRYVGEGATVEHLRIADLAPYAPCDTVPDSLAAFRARAAEMDGILILVTQHLSGVTGTLKNALDWLGAPTSALADKPIAVAGLACAPGTTFAGVQQVRSALTALDAATMKQPDYSFVISNDTFDSEGHVVNVTVADDLAGFLTAARGYFAHEVRAAEVDATLPQTSGPISSVSGSLPSLSHSLEREMESHLAAAPLHDHTGPVSPVDADFSSVANPLRHRA